MAISFVGQATGTTTATMPAHQAGDLILVWAFRDGNVTAPTVPSGYGAIVSGGANTCSAVLAWRIAPTSSETVGTWTNATSVVVQVYRPGSGKLLAVGATAQGGAASTTVNYPALSLLDTGSTSWAAGFSGHRSVDTTLENAPTGMTARSTVVDATDEAAGFDTNGVVTSWSAQNVAVGGTSAGWRSATVEIREITPPSGVEFLTSDTVFPTVPEDSDTGDYTLGTTFTVGSAQTCLGIRFFRNGSSAALGGSPYQVALYEAGNATPLATKSFSGPVPGWNYVAFDTPVSLDPSKVYIAAYWNYGLYADTSGYFAASKTSSGGRITAPQDGTTVNGVTVKNGTFFAGSTLALPDSTFGSTFYWVEPGLQVSGGPTTVSGTGASSNVGNAAAAGRAIAAATAAASGTVSVAGTGRSLNAATAAASGSGAASGTGIALAAATAGAFGLSDAQASAAFFRPFTGTSGSLSTADAVGTGIAAATAQASGAASAAASSSASGEATATAAGTSLADASGKATAEALGSVSASSVAQGSGVAFVPATGAASGAASVSGNGLGVITRTATASTTASASASATGRATIVATASASGSGTVTGAAIVTLAGVGQAAGSSVADGRAGSSTLATATAAAAGTSTGTASATATAIATAAAAGSATVTATSNSTAIVTATGSAAASSAAAAIGRHIVTSLAQASGSAGAAGAGIAAGAVTATASAAGTSTADAAAIPLRVIAATAQAAGAALADARASHGRVGIPLPGQAHAGVLFGTTRRTRLIGTAPKTTLKDH